MSVAAPASSHFSPWLTVWWKPRVTIERIVAANPKHHVLLLAAIGGVASLLTQLIFADFAIELVDWRLIAIGSIAAAIFGVVSLYIAGVIFAWSGRLLGGHASPTTMRAVLAWRPAPSVIALAICLIVIGGLKLSGSAEAPAPTFQQLFAVLPIIAVAFAIWSIIMTMLMLARIQRFGFWRTVAGFALGEVLIVVVSLVLALVIRSFLFQPFNAPSGSMKPTLLIGDYFFVSKFSYGYTHYSLPFSPKLFSGRIVASEPKLGDVVVFRLPKDDSTDYIKRIVGLPGDRIQMINGHLHINGEPVKREQIDDFVDIDDSGRTVRIKRWRLTLPNGVSYEALDMMDNGFYDNTPVYNVPPGHYFMLGDNLDNSTDSRVLSQVGYVPFENLIGRAVIIFHSVDRDSPTRPRSSRPERIGKLVR